MRLPRTALALVAALPLTVAAPAPAAPGHGAPGQQKPGNQSFAVIGDVPYGDAQVAAFPGWIDQINADRDIDLTIHVGDIKNGSSTCTNEYFSSILTQFNRFEKPLVYTPGDNEWTDCHRANNGAYNPLERLATIRSMFFATPGRTLGQKTMKVDSQASAGIPENVQLRKDGVQMAVVHVVGSNDSTLPWSGLGQTTPNAEQLAEHEARMTNAIAVVKDSFAQARKRHDRAVAVFLQADMFLPGYTPSPAEAAAFAPFVQAPAAESAAFDGEVYLFDGDSHVYNVDRPLAAGSRWLTTYGVTGSADNLTRITVDGSDNNTDWLKVTINRRHADQVLSWQQVPYTK